MVWMCLVAGAKGIGYFPVAFNPFRWANITPEMKAEMTRLNGEIMALAPALLEGEVLEAAVEGDQATVRALQHGGKTTLLAVNLTREKVSARVVVKGLADKTLYPRGKAEGIASQGGAIALTLEPLGCAVLTEEKGAE